ncbi:tRNA (uracil-5-)-methyltransferase homolog A-like [Prorops nasuta]|uniref:tRNA (uracil-5-)-methyltransferase homolog A-like n=1 Tax=Prorops nasuta TaxID=863751 RepID=UPI0034CFF348
MNKVEPEPVSSDETVKKNDDPYAYLDRDDFTSEKYKIEVRGLPKYYGVGELKRFINEKLDLKSCKIKPLKKGCNILYLCFRNEENKLRAISVLNGIQWKSKTLRAQPAKPAADPFLKRKIEEETANKRQKTDTNEEGLSPSERVQISTIPLCNVSYINQLEQKQNEMKLILRKIGLQIFNENKDLSKWLETQTKEYDGLPCELKPILHSDATQEYRNKCEFTIGYNVKGDKIIIGFRLSSYAAGCTAVGPIDHLCHIPKCMKEAVKIFEGFVQNYELKAYNPVDHSGHWRQITARSTRGGHLMLILGISAQNLNSEVLNKLKFDLQHFFENGKGIEAKVTSLYLHTLDKKSTNGSSESNIEHISGAKFIEEVLLGMKFRISPLAFFQINTLGAEVLYKAAIELAEPTMDTTVLDICCGTGTIGLSFSKYCGEVLGLEVVSDAIQDARQNAIENQIENCEFLLGKAEDILSAVIHRATKSSIIAVVDPPRAGLHQKALSTLRNMKKVNRIVYISCNPRAAMRNLVDFARPASKQYIGEPFVPVKAVAIDMFPHTNHCELIICLDRCSKAMEPLNDSTNGD